MFIVPRRNKSMMTIFPSHPTKNDIIETLSQNKICCPMIQWWGSSPRFISNSLTDNRDLDVSRLASDGEKIMLVPFPKSPRSKKHWQRLNPWGKNVGLLMIWQSWSHCFSCFRLPDSSYLCVYINILLARGQVSNNEQW